MNEKKLGRGIASLLAMDDNLDIDFGISNQDTIKREGIELKTIDINNVFPNPNQPRKFFDNNKLRELSESIKNNGLLQPILVSIDENNKEKYIIVAGERRYRASKLAGLNTIQAVVLDIDEKEILKNAIIENVQREDLNPIEEATGYKKVIDVFGYTHEQLAKEIGKSRAYITNLLRILTLPENVQNALKNNNISLGHAKVLLGEDDPEKYLSDIIEKQLSVRQLEKLIESNSLDATNNEQTFDNLKDNKKETHNEIDENNTANITFDMIKQLYSPLLKENEGNIDNENQNKISNSEIGKIKQKISQPTMEEWNAVQKNVKTIEKQLTDSCGFDIKLNLKQNGSGHLEIKFTDADELLDIVKFLQ